MTAQNFDEAFLPLSIIRIPRTALLFTSNDCEMFVHSFENSEVWDGRGWILLSF